MPAEQTIVAPAATTAPAQPPAEKQPEAELAAPQADAKPDGEDQSQGREGETDAQKTIRKLQRRIDRLTAQKGARDYEVQQLSAQLQRVAQPQGEDEAKGEPEQVEATARDMARRMAADMREAEWIRDRVGKALKEGGKLDGFDAACNAVNEELPFYDGRGRPTPFARAVLDADAPHELLHYLGNNLDEVAELVSLSPEQIGRRIARIESRLDRDARKSSAAPAPLTPVRASASPAMPDPEKDPAGWRAWRNKTAKVQ